MRSQILGFLLLRGEQVGKEFGMSSGLELDSEQLLVRIKLERGDRETF